MKTKKKRADWIPTQLLRFFLWQATFMTEIQDSVIGPLTGIPTGTGSKLAALLSLQSAYVVAYGLAPPHMHPDKALNTARNKAQKLFKSGIRQITSQYIRHNDALTDLQKQQIGLPITAKTGTGAHNTITTGIIERTIPDYPAISAKSNSPGTVTFSFGELGSKSHGIPAGMHHLLIQYITTAANAAAPTGEDVCTKHLEPQKSPFTKDLTRELSGQKLWAFAAWVDTRGVIHTWSPVFFCIIT
ncbi:MAG: hypothetical protein ACYDCN_07360 [Bacteroidia bacterium]